MRVDISTICTADYFQHYIPMYAYCLQKAYPDWRVCIGVIGELDDLTRKAISYLDNCQVRAQTSGLQVEETPVNAAGVVITENVGTDVPLLESTSNTMRNLWYLETPGRKPGTEQNTVLTTDIDLLFFKTPVSPLDWCTRRMNVLGSCYYAHHGPWKKPRRFDGGWCGDRERLSNGVVLVTADWFRLTKAARDKYEDLLRKGEIGTYREEDEVVLCKIMKESDLPITKSKFYDPIVRGVHLGDFKSSMEHRWTSLEKMREKLALCNIEAYQDMTINDKTWCKIEREVRKDPIIDQILTNVQKHIQERGA